MASFWAMSAPFCGAEHVIRVIQSVYSVRYPIALGCQFIYFPFFVNISLSFLFFTSIGRESVCVPL